MRLNHSLWRIILTNLGPPFTGSAFLLYVTELRETRLLNLAEISWLMFGISLASFAGPLLAGALARSVRPHWQLWGATGLYLFCLAGVALSLNPWVLAPAFFSLGMAYSVIVVISSAQLAARVPAQTHALIALQMAATAVGGMVAPPVAAYLLRVRPVTASPHPALPLALTAAAVSIVCLSPALFCRDYLPPDGPRRRGFPWRYPFLWWLLLLSGLHGLCDNGSWGWMPMWLQDRAHSGRGIVATLISLAWVASLCGRGLTIVLARRLGSPLALRLAAVGAGLGITLTFASHSAWGLILAYCFYCIWSAGNLPGLVSLLNERLPEWRGEVTGLLLAFLNGAGALGTGLIGRAAVVANDASAGMPIPMVSMLLFATLLLLHPAVRLPRPAAPSE